jgi:hypothetical protein
LQEQGKVLPDRAFGDEAGVDMKRDDGDDAIFIYMKAS